LTETLTDQLFSSIFYVRKHIVSDHCRSDMKQHMHIFTFDSFIFFVIILFLTDTKILSFYFTQNTNLMAYFIPCL